MNVKGMIKVILYEILQYEKEIICSSYYEHNFSYAEKVVNRCN